MCEISIVFEDNDILVVNKPAGLATQAPIAFDSLEARIRKYLAENTDPDDTVYLGIPHRLDRCVSGAMVFAKRRKAAQRLSKQFELREVKKSYLATVSGCVEPSSGEWRDYLRKIPDEPRGEAISEDQVGEFPDAKLAILQYEVSTISPDQTQLKVCLETGRMHQIRIQCAVRGHPVVGDVMYGSETPFGAEPSHERERQVALHANEIEFLHPRVKERMTFSAPLPSTWPIAN